MKDINILRTTGLSKSKGVIHIEAIGYDGETYFIEWDSYAMLEDIPSLHYFAKEAIKEDEKAIKEKYKEFKKTL